MWCIGAPWSGSSGKRPPSPTLAEVAEERSECLLTEFGQAMSDLSTVQWRLADVHAREIAKLNMANEELRSQVSDLQARIDDLNRQQEANYFSLAIAEGEVVEPMPTQAPKALDDVSYSLKKTAIQRAVCSLDDIIEAGSSQESDGDSGQHIIADAGPALPDPTSGAGSPFGSPFASEKGDQLESEVKERSSTRLTKVLEATERCSRQMRQSDLKDRVSARASALRFSYQTSLKGVVHKSSMRSARSARSEASVATQSTRQSVRTLDTAVSSAESMKTERRHKRLRTALQARLRSTWIFESDMDEIVPRWSQTSQATFDSDFLASVGSERTAHSGSNNTSWDTKVSIKPLIRLATSRPCCVNTLVIHPQSRFKTIIDILGIMIMGYDFMMTPLLFFDLQQSPFITAMGWVTRMFWTLDMWLNFHVGVYKKGVLVTNLREVAKEYLKGMFLLDFAIVVVEWLAYVLEQAKTDVKSLENVYVLRILKGLRFAKVIRIFKFERIMQEFRAQINSTIILLWLKPMILLFFLLVFNHTLACIWYGIGTSSNGWTSREVSDSSFSYMYFTSLHWAVSQFHGNMEVFPQNFPERVFMCSVNIIALILYSTFLSSITNGMMQIQALRSERNDRLHKLRACLARRNVSAELTMRIKKRLDYLGNQAELDYEDSVLECLPKDLTADLYTESRSPVVLGHNFFSMLNVRQPRIVRQLCFAAMSEMPYLPDQTVFSAGDACLGMSFVTSGDLIYDIKDRRTQTNAGAEAIPADAIPEANNEAEAEADAELERPEVPNIQRSSVTHHRSDMSHVISQCYHQASSYGSAPTETSFMLGAQSTFVMSGSWLAEASLWLIWEYCGRLGTRTPALLLNVDALKFADVVTKFHFAHVNSSRYAKRFIERMVGQGICTDLVPDDL